MIVVLFGEECLLGAAAVRGFGADFYVAAA
jgi:hypothetical protein